MLDKINKTESKDEPFYGQRGELNLLNVLLDLFIAGSETTSNTMNWSMLYMVLNPEIQDKVRQELDGTIGKCLKTAF